MTRDQTRAPVTCVRTALPAPSSRRRDLGHDVPLNAVKLAPGPPYAAARSPAFQRNSVPSIHMRCMITPILRASATLARYGPRRLATSIPQRLSAENRFIRDNKMLAAS